MGTDQQTTTDRVTPDPRPHVVRSADGEHRVTGSRCTSCRYPMATAVDRCPVCGGTCVADEFGPGATVFAATVLRIPVPGRTPPFGLSYVDLDDGPRILAHVDRDDAALAPRSRVRVVGTTGEGDPLVTPDTTPEEAS